MLKKGDLILIAVLAAVIILGYAGIKLYRNMNYGSHKVAVIKQDGNVLRSIDLDTVQKPERITVNGSYENIILVERGRIRFEKANCPDLVCVKTGWLSESGASAICLPNHTTVKIEGVNPKVDVVTW